jgi:hypothetical protein
MTTPICGMPSGRHVGLVVEDAAEVVAVGEHLVLGRQVGAAGIDEVDAGQAVLRRDLLRAQVLLHRHREIGAALHRGVVGDDHAFDALHAADAGDHAGRGDLVVVHASRHGGEFEEGRAGIEQGVDALARQQLAARDMLLAMLLGPTAARPARSSRAGRRPARLHRRDVGLVLVAAGVERWT